MFARIDMGAIAQRKLATMDGHGRRFQVLRRTVPGMKDLAVAARQLIEGDVCGPLPTLARQAARNREE